MLSLAILLSALLALTIAAGATAPTTQADADAGAGLNLSSCYGENGEDSELLPWEIGHGGTYININCAPPGAQVAYVDVHVIVDTSASSVVALGYGPFECVIDWPLCASIYAPRQPDGSINAYLNRLYNWTGSDVNGTWALEGKTFVGWSMLDYWSIRVYYAPPGSPTPTPTPGGPTATSTPQGLRHARIPISADTMTSSGNPVGIYRISPELYAGYLRHYYTWLKFDLAAGGIPADATVLKADLNLFYLGDPGGDVSLDVFAPLADWSDTTLSWNNQPAFDPTVRGSHWVSRGEQLYIAWNITSLVQEWVNGLRPNWGLMLTDHNDSKDARFASKENYIVPNAPYLDVVYTSAGTPTSTPTPTVTTTQTPTSTPTRTPTRTNTPTPTVTTTQPPTITPTPTSTATPSATPTEDHGGARPYGIRLPLIMMYY